MITVIKHLLDLYSEIAPQIPNEKHDLKKWYNKFMWFTRFILENETTSRHKQKQFS